MLAYDSNKYLTCLENAIEARQPETFEPMSGDRWLITSALQKSIRRGEFKRASEAATALWHLDRSVLWKRLAIITVEDCGASSPETVTKVLTAIAATRWRKSVGDLRVALHLIKLLCGTVKTRLADAVFNLAEKSSIFAETRRLYAEYEDSRLISQVLNKEASLIERAIAIWLLTGTNKYPSDTMFRRGDTAIACDALRGIVAPSSLIESCIATIGRSSYPLNAFTPLIWAEINSQPTTHVYHPSIPPTPDVQGLPLYAACTFTRVGKTCYRLLKASVPALKPFTADQISLGMFYVESHLVNSLLTSPELSVIQNTGEVADFESVGLTQSLSEELKIILRNCSANLACIREDQLKKHLLSLTAEVCYE